MQFVETYQPQTPSVHETYGGIQGTSLEHSQSCARIVTTPPFKQTLIKCLIHRHSFNVAAAQCQFPCKMRYQA
jgi:hypothetical protein